MTTETYTTMHLFALNMLLMLAWGALTGQFTAISLLGGFALGWIILWFIQPLYGQSGYFRKPLLLIFLVLGFLYRLVVSSLRVAWEILTITNFSRPGIVAVPLDVTTDMQILLLSNYISLTPGSLLLDVSEDRKTLYVHDMFIDNPDAVRRAIKDGIEKYILELTQ